MTRRKTGWETLTRPRDSAVLAEAAARAERRLSLDVADFRAPVARLVPELFRFTGTEHPDVLALRFLRARKWDLEKAVDMLVGTLKWRYKAGFADFFRDMERLVGDKGLAAEKGYLLPGADLEGRPVLAAHFSRHDPKACQVIESKRLALYLVETVRVALRAPAEALTLVVDFKGFGLSNMDMDLAKFMIGALEAYFPESLGAALLVDAPFIFRGVWAVLKQLLDPVVASKIHFISKSKVAEYVPRSSLPKSLGGDAEEYRWIPPKDKSPRGDPAEGEEQATERWTEAWEAFMAATRAWVRDGGDVQAAKREEAARELQERARMAQKLWMGETVYRRNGTLT
ncbi:CRAL-TRIO domain-containing protein [Hyaloraphidium curvatum]|nr:CRAL-TRIO domain-containing protein [Hyaloraphidium curvatum]